MESKSKWEAHSRRSDCIWILLRGQVRGLLAGPVVGLHRHPCCRELLAFTWTWIPLTRWQSSKGIYAGHIWQGSTGRNGASAFTETLKDKIGKTPKVWRNRDADEFRAVAVDVWGQPTPEEFQEERYSWESIVDNQNGPYGISNDGSDVEIWYMTLAKR
jgi:hypothetical protein